MRQARQVSASTIGEFAEVMHLDADWRAQADVFTAAVVKEMATKKDYTEEQLNYWYKTGTHKGAAESIYGAAATTRYV